MPEGFVGKASTEFSWSHKQTEEAIAEYKRFVYLNQIADHPLSPPREVDLIWHMHLLYTRHYWGPWTELLETPLHHEPAPTSGKVDLETYGATRALYTQEFDDFVAEKIWPSLKTIKRQERAGGMALLCFFTAFFAIIAAVVTQNAGYAVFAGIAFLGFFVLLFFVGPNNRKGSFGVSSGGGGSDGGCGD